MGIQWRLQAHMRRTPVWYGRIRIQDCNINTLIGCKTNIPTGTWHFAEVVTDLGVTGLLRAVHQAPLWEAVIPLAAHRAQVVREAEVRLRVALPRCVAALLRQAIPDRAVDTPGDTISTVPCLLESRMSRTAHRPAGLLVPVSRRPNHSTEMSLDFIKIQRHGLLTTTK